ncbi:MAG TPA: hypothetical protein VGL81_17555 [Polyangiaceae bacterium]
MTYGTRAALLACLGALTGCSSVLGLDAPTLDPCTTGGACVDAGLDGTVEASDAASSPDASASDGPADAASEAGPDAAPACVWDGAVPDASAAGVRCGGGCEPVVFCTGTTPVCCQTTASTGAPAFACASSETTCTGYAIDCVNENDCSGSDVCCHYIAHTVCAASCTSGGDIACLPGSSEDCPTGKKCSVPVMNGDAAAPYYTCQP